MKTKLLATLLVLNTSLSLVMAQSQSSTPTSEDCFVIDNTTLSDYICNETAVVIPESISGQQILSIGTRAFHEKQLTSVEIPNSVTSISEGAFAGNQLTSVMIPDSVTSIGFYAFWQNELTTVTIPNSMSNLHPYAFNRNVSITRR